MAIRIRWYVARASLDVSGRASTALPRLVGPDAYLTAIWAPNRTAPTAALVRVIAEQATLEALEARVDFGTEALVLRVNNLWSSVPNTQRVRNILSAFGVTYQSIPPAMPIGDVVRTLGRRLRGLAWDRREDLVRWLSSEQGED